ncbi:hypothetical protein Tco_1136597 [Tanacetum coccineum]
MSWRQFILALCLHTPEEMVTDGFGVYWADSSRVIAYKVDLRDYWTRISSIDDFLTTVPSYTAIREPLRRLFHCLIAFTIAGRGQAPKKVTTTDLYFLRSMDEGTVNVSYLLAQYLFRHVEGRKQGAKMSGGHFIARLAEHFRVITKEILRGSIVVVRDLTMINMDELVRLRICERLGNVWAWVALGLKRQKDVAANHEILEEGVQADLTPVQAPQAPPATPTPKTMPQRVLRLEEEVCRLRESFGEQPVVVDMMSRDLSRFTTWAVGCLGQLLDVSGVTYLRYKESHVPYQRRVRQRTNDGASTSAASHDQDQPDP